MLKQDKPLFAALLAVAIALALNAAVSTYESACQFSVKQNQLGIQSDQLLQSGRVSFWQQTLHDPVTLFTGVLAFFTIALVGTSMWQGRLTQRTVDLAHREFVASHRPKLRIRLLTLRPPIIEQPLVFEFAISNIGDSSAAKVSYLIYFEMPENSGIGVRRWDESGKGFFVEIPAGVQADVTHVTDFVCPAKWFAEYTGGRLVVGGLISYMDANGVTRLTSFRRLKASGRSQSFVKMEPINPDFEYEN